ncbi:MAG: DUF2182 domain-containing protein [Pseudomonas sp.]
MARQANAPLPAWVRDTCNDPLKCALWAASLVAFVLMALGDDSHHDLESFCISGSPSMLTEGWLNVRLYYSSMDIAVFTGAVGLMLVAMMLPALQGPLAHLWRQSSPYQGGPAVTAFLLGYFCVWLAGSALLLIVALLLVSFTGSQLVAGLLALIGAGGWQWCTIRARCLARCHRREKVANPLAMGAMHGVWCCATCWPLMLIAFCLPAVHLPVMIAGAIIIAHERRAAHPGQIDRTCSSA